jgi:adenylate cyclase
MRAVCLCRLGRQGEGLEWAERARSIDPDDPGVIYNVACLYALEGQADLAIDCLEQALRAGFGAGDWVAHDPDLDSLRDLPRFQRLIWK